MEILATEGGDEVFSPKMICAYQMIEKDKD
jgi:hypothetical protein